MLAWSAAVLSCPYLAHFRRFSVLNFGVPSLLSNRIGPAIWVLTTFMLLCQLAGCWIVAVWLKLCLWSKIEIWLLLYST